MEKDCAGDKGAKRTSAHAIGTQLILRLPH